ncbi:MAG TPA: ATP-dependent DNA ligase [Chthoniobacterales bacterium]
MGLRVNSGVIEVRYEDGVYLPQPDFWLDPPAAKPFAFVSHAHSDHIAPHAEVVLSERTARLLQARMPGKRREHILPFGQQQTLRGMDVTLLPAGHIFGSAQIFMESDAGSLLYTGDFKLRPGRSAEPAEWKHADTLIMETTYGLPRYRLPPTEQVVAQIVAFCREALEEGDVPVLLGYSLGKAQEILCALDGAGLVPMLHGAVFAMTRIYEQCGQSFCQYARYQANDVAGKVLICPPSAHRSRMLEKITRKRVAMITGWAVDAGAIYRYQVDAAFALSDHADYSDLIRYVELVQPARVLTLHGFAAEFARDLRDRGLEAWALSAENQMELRLRGATTGEFDGSTESRPTICETDGSTRSASLSAGSSCSTTERETTAVAASEFRRLAEVGEAIGQTPAKREKIRLLSDYLRSLDQPALSLAATYLTGRAFAQADVRTLQVGWAVIFRALQAATKIREAEFRRIASSHGDAGQSAFEAMEGRTRPEPFSMIESRELFDQLQRARGPSAKTELLQARLEKLSAREGQYLVKILTGDLRIGLKEGLVEEAIARAFDASVDEVKEANMLLGDLGATVALAARKELNRAKLSVFRPIKSMLASPEPTAEAIWARFQEERPSANGERRESAAPAAGPPVIYVEDKFDGIRAQLHRSGQRVEIFSRDLRRITEQFPELAERAAGFRDDLILDGEIVALAEGRKLSFFDLQKRLGRKSEGADLFATASADVPVAFVIFDILWRNGDALLKTPLRERRAFLRELELPPQFQLSQVFPARSAGEIERIFGEARRRLNEGLMIKDSESFYSPGRRGLFWFKLKKELATLDVVVVAAELGHGRRNQVLSDYTFAVRDENTGDLLPIGKAYSGLTDSEIAELTEHFKQNTLADRGRRREVKPDVVLEIAFDSIQPSSRHASGLALRFPRIKAIRRDKTVETIDTLRYARALATRGESAKDFR